MVTPQIYDVPGKGRIIHAGGITMGVNMPVPMAMYPQGTKPVEELRGSYKYAPAGSANDMFEKLLKDAGENTILTPGIKFKAEMIYGGGIGVRKVSAGENGERITTEIYHKEFEKFNKSSRFYEQFMAATVDLIGLGSAYYQPSLNTKGDKIMLLTTQNTRCRNTRLGWKDDRGRIKEAHINADFGRGYESTAVTKVLPLVDIAFDPAEWLRNYVQTGRTARHFVYPVQHISLGADNYYPVPDWNTARASEWLSVSRKVSKLKNFMIDNIVNLKLHIEVAEEYWGMRYGSEQWASWSEKEQIDKMMEESVRLDKFFKGIEGGSVFMTSMFEKGFDKELKSAIKITEFKEYFRDGVHVEDSQEAAANILFSLGLHTSLFGSGSSKGLGNSGSENKYAFNQRKGLIKFTREQLLSPLYLVAEYNGWQDYEDIEFFVRDTEDLKSDSEVSPNQRDNQLPE